LCGYRGLALAAVRQVLVGLKHFGRRAYAAVRCIEGGHGGFQRRPVVQRHIRKYVVRIEGGGQRAQAAAVYPKRVLNEEVGAILGQLLVLVAPSGAKWRPAGALRRVGGGKAEASQIHIVHGFFWLVVGYQLLAFYS
jgi:hypothetical protein